MSEILQKQYEETIRLNQQLQAKVTELEKQRDYMIVHWMSENCHKKLQSKVEALEEEVKLEEKIRKDIISAHTILADGYQAGLDKANKEIKRLKEAIQGALRISNLWTLDGLETMFEDEAKALLLMKKNFEQALEVKE